MLRHRMRAGPPEAIAKVAGTGPEGVAASGGVGIRAGLLRPGCGFLRGRLARGALSGKPARPEPRPARLNPVAVAADRLGTVAPEHDSRPLPACEAGLTTERSAVPPALGDGLGVRCAEATEAARTTARRVCAAGRV